MERSTRTAQESFIAYWHRFSASSPPLAHPEDEQWLLRTSNEFELSLLPVPVNGDLAQAEVVICMLNPGFDDADHEWERLNPFRQSLINSLTQKFAPSDFPFTYLDPRFDQHPGAGYWIGGRKASPGRKTQQKLLQVTLALARSKGMSFEDARHYISRKVAIVQLLPYHSRTLGQRNLLGFLPSCLQARALIQGLIDERKKLVVIPRAAAEWGYGESANEHLVVYKPSLGASASLTPQSPGGTAILRRLSGAGRA